MLNIVRHFLKEQEREEKAALRDRQSQAEKPERLPPFKHWLGKRSPRQANLWRFRRRIAPHMRVRPFEFPRTGVLSTPFPAYREMVKRRFADVKLARSRLDYMTALYLRCAGYTTQEVANEVFRHTPARPKGQSRDERIEYGRRVVWYAFGTAGDIDIANVRTTEEYIQRFNREAEDMERDRIHHETRERQARPAFRLR